MNQLKCFSFFDCLALDSFDVLRCVPSFDVRYVHCVTDALHVAKTEPTKCPAFFEGVS